ncbi:MAG: amino acid ABC transporter ATP-binding protein [Clostridia bacterium]|nr:amino acid ABC transporter ATP-binding protein [Clostridia bacterium]
MRIELDGIRLAFTGGTDVLDDLTFSTDFQALAVIGPSGGGKSTLLRVIAGLIAPSAGSLRLDGQPVEWVGRGLQRYQRTIGFVFQSRGLFPHLTAIENITLPLIHVFGQTPAEARETAMRYLRRFSLENDGNKYPVELSGGQQQRIAIARAVAVRPRLLLLDEPTSALDPELTAEVLDMIAELKSDGLHLILVTHEMGFARKSCDQAVFLAAGRAIETGPAEQLFSRPSTPELKAFLDKILEWSV